MEAPHSNVDPNDGNKDFDTIFHEIRSDAQQILAQNFHNHNSNGFGLVENSFLENHPGQYFGAVPSIPSVASPPSILSSVASPPMTVNCEGYPITLDSNFVRPSTEMSNGFLPSPIPAATGVAQLIITEQPVERCRFRYRAEHSPHGALRGADKRQKSCPKIKIENFKGRGYVVATLFTNEDEPRRHINELWGFSNNCANGECRVDLDGNMCAAFPNLGIMRQKENDVTELLYQKHLKQYIDLKWEVTDDIKENLRKKAQLETATMKDCLHCVRLGFQAHLVDETNGREFSTYPIVLSSPIFNSRECFGNIFPLEKFLDLRGCFMERLGTIFSENTGYSELKIAEIDKSCGHAIGGDRIWLRCAAKIRRDQVKIVFHEPNSNWEAEGVFTASDVYEQILIIFKTPAYHDVNITERVHVNIHLLRTSDKTYSPAVDFVYLPVDDGRSSIRDLDSGIAADLSLSSQDAGPSMTSLSDVRSRIEHLSLAELNRVGAVGEAGKLQHYLTGLWETHVRALWNFSSEGDPEPFVSACKGLLGLQDEGGNTAIHTAVKNKQSFALKTMLKVLDSLPNKQQIIDERNFKKQTALHLAIRFGDNDCVHYLITAGADRTAIDADGQTVAHYLAETFNEDIYRDILFPPNETTASRQKIDLTVMNDEGDTAVHLAVKRKKLALLETLLEAEASVNDVERNTGKSALHLAVDAGDAEMVDLLLQNRISTDLQAHDGTTALQLAAKLKNAPITAKLITAGANANEKTSSSALTSEPKEKPEGEAAAAGEEEEEEEDVMEGENAELHSAFDFAGDDQIILDILKGKPYAAPTPVRPPPASPQESVDGAMASVAVGGARPKTSPYMSSTSSKHSLVPPGATPTRLSPSAFASEGAEAAGGDTGITWTPRTVRRLASSRSSSGSPEPLPAFIRDDLSTLDYVTRIRLSKLLDESGRWEELAKSLGCEDMIDLLKVCCEADNSSPTVLLLDQLEHKPGYSVTSLLNALRDGGHRAAVDMIIRKKQQQEQGGTGEGNLDDNMGAGC